MSCTRWWYERKPQVLIFTELKPQLFELYLLAEPLTDEGGEEIGVPGENSLTTSFRKYHINQKIKPQPRLEPAL